jgi:hypothetical protein
MIWQEALRRGEAVEDFNAFLARLRAQAQRRQDDAETLAEMKEAVGAKKVLDSITRSVTLDTREEQEYGRAHGTSSDARSGAGV